MNVILCGGGTAGHINPAIAIADEIKKKYKDSKILFIGREGGNENKLVTKAGYSYKLLKINGLRRKLSIRNLKVISDAFKAKNKAERIIEDFSPDFIIGTGGYVCWPVLSAGYDKKIPIYIHESNVFPGLTTRLLSKKCNKVFISCEESKEYLPKKTKAIAVGNPVKVGFQKANRREARAKLGVSQNDFMILSCGGSLGAERINEAVYGVMKDFSSKRKNVIHLHSVGEKNYSEEKAKSFSKSDRCIIVPFIDDMPTAMAAADVVICRCGAITLAELATVGTAAILIPSPNVANDHQTKNASILNKKGAAIVIAEKELNAINLKRHIEDLLSDPQKRDALSKSIKIFSKNNVEKTILQEIEKKA